MIQPPVQLFFRFGQQLLKKPSGQIITKTRPEIKHLQLRPKEDTFVRRSVREDNKLIIFGNIASCLDSGKTCDNARQAPTLTGGGLSIHFTPFSSDHSILFYFYEQQRRFQKLF